MAEQGSKLSLYPTTIPITDGWAVDSEMYPICHMGMLQDDVISPLVMTIGGLPVTCSGEALGRKGVLVKWKLISALRHIMPRKL